MRFFSRFSKEKPRPRNVIAKISADELELLRTNKNLIQHYQSLLLLAKTGYQAVWWQLRTKYQFGEKVDFDWSTGEIFDQNNG
jgi:hypothetical protein